MMTAIGHSRPRGRAPAALIPFLLLPFFALAAGAARAAEIGNPAGVIDKDTVWEGTVRVVTPTRVTRDAVLTVKSGTVVLFARGAGLVVEGRLVAEGSRDARVRFASADASPTPGAWTGIRFAASLAGCVMTRCTIANAEGIQIVGSSPAIRDCAIADGRVGIMVEKKAGPEISGNVISGMSEAGIVVEQESAPRVSKNTIASCKIVGIHSSRGASPVLRENTISECATGISFSGVIPPVEGNVLRKNKIGLGFTMAGAGQIVRGNRFLENETGIDCSEFSSPVIERNEFSENGDALVCFRGSSPTVRNNEFAKNSQGIVCANMSNPAIAANDIHGNRKGIYLTFSSYATIHGNNIYENDVQLELGLMSSDWERKTGAKPRRGKQAQLDKRMARGKATAEDLAQSGDGAVIMGGVDATGNWWGDGDTAEMERKGPDANIESLIDYYDKPTHPSEGYPGEYEQDRIIYRGWKKSRIEGAGFR